MKYQSTVNNRFMEIEQQISRLNIELERPPKKLSDTRVEAIVIEEINAQNKVINENIKSNLGM